MAKNFAIFTGILWVLLAPGIAQAATVKSGAVFITNSSGTATSLEGKGGDLEGGDIRIGFSSFNGTLELNADTTPNTVTDVRNVDDLTIGSNTAKGALTVRGDGSPGSATVTVQDDFRLGANDDSSLSILNGGQLFFVSPPTGRAGQAIFGSYSSFEAGTGNTETLIDGNGSLLEINGRLSLGFNNGLGSDDMTISNGARVIVKEPDDFADRAIASQDFTQNTSGVVSLGGDAEFGTGQALDTLTVTGTGSELVFSSSFFTNSGNNLIVVSDGGAIRQNEVGNIAASAAGYGFDPDEFFGISLGSAIGDAELLITGEGSMVFASRNIQSGYGDVFVGFEDGDFNKPLFDPSSAKITVSDNALLRTTKDIVISEKDENGTGFLVVEKNARVEAANVVVNDGGKLSGDGGFIAANVILDGGVIAPGASPGILTIDGDLEVLDGLLSFEIGGSALGLFDQLFVTGDLLTPNGLTIDLVFMYGAKFETGSVFDILNIDGAATIFDTPENIKVSVSGLQGGQFDLSFANGGIAGTYTSSGPTAPVTLPASLPLLLAAFGGLAITARRRR